MISENVLNGIESTFNTLTKSSDGKKLLITLSTPVIVDIETFVSLRTKLLDTLLNMSRYQGNGMWVLLKSHTIGYYLYMIIDMKSGNHVDMMNSAQNSWIFIIQNHFGQELINLYKQNMKKTFNMTPITDSDNLLIDVCSRLPNQLPTGLKYYAKFKFHKKKTIKIEKSNDSTIQMKLGGK